MSTQHPVIVVGYDGSPAARAAVEVAIDRLASGGKLVVVHAHTDPSGYIGDTYYQQLLEATVDRAKAVVADLVADCARLSTVDWEPDLVSGPAGDAIARVASVREADEIVIGTRGRGHLRSALGSVSLDVLHRAGCPVVVIPERMVREPSPVR